LEIYLDSSKISEAKRWKSVVTGYTTNPSILLKDGSNIYEFCQAVAPLPVSVEACGDFVQEAHKYWTEINHAVIKIPLLKPGSGDNLDVIRQLSSEGIKVNCTALFSLSQVILATKAGAAYVSLFAGRVDDEGGYSTTMISDCVEFLESSEVWNDVTKKHTHTKLIVGSIRTVSNVLDAVRAGAHIVTIPPPILEKMLDHKYSRVTSEQFERDSQCLKK
jgi:transaldolase